MKEENYQIQDESGDRNYFTIIPNFILNHSTVYDRDLYIQMKRIAGEKGSCWMSQKSLAKQCGVSINRLKKSLKYLIDHKWIKFAGKKTINTSGGVQEVMEYKIIDLWKLNNQFYEEKYKGVSRDDTPKAKGVSRDDTKGCHEMTQGVSPNDDKEEPMNKNHLNKNIVAKATEDTFSLKNYYENKMFNAKDKRMPIIAGYWIIKGFAFENEEQIKSAVKRELRPAGLLKGYSLERIKETLIYLKENADFKWTLETVSKYIDEDLEILTNKKLNREPLAVVDGVSYYTDEEIQKAKTMGRIEWNINKWIPTHQQ